MAVTTLGTAASGEWTTTQAPPAFNHTLSAGSNRWVIVVASAEDAADNFTTATYGGNAMTQIAVPDSGGVSHGGLWVIAEASLPANGVNSVAVSATGTMSRGRIWCHTVQDADQTALDAAQIASALSASATNINDTLTSVTGGLIVAIGSDSAGGGATNDLTFSGGTLGTEVVEEDVEPGPGQMNHLVSSVPVTTGGTTTIDYERTPAAPMVMAGVCFSPVAAASGGIRPLVGSGNGLVG